MRQLAPFLLAGYGAGLLAAAMPHPAMALGGILTLIGLGLMGLSLKVTLQIRGLPPLHLSRQPGSAETPPTRRRCWAVDSAGSPASPRRDQPSASRSSCSSPASSRASGHASSPAPPDKPADADDAGVSVDGVLTRSPTQEVREG